MFEEKRKECFERVHAGDIVDIVDIVEIVGIVEMVEIVEKYIVYEMFERKVPVRAVNNYSYPFVLAVGRYICHLTAGIHCHCDWEEPHFC